MKLNVAKDERKLRDKKNKIKTTNKTTLIVIFSQQQLVHRFDLP
jgi:hypothetical protein